MERISLSREECLTIENVELKLALAQSEFAKLQTQKEQWRVDVEKQHGVDLTGWQINIREGFATAPGVQAS